MKRSEMIDLIFKPFAENFKHNTPVVVTPFLVENILDAIEAVGMLPPENPDLSQDVIDNGLSGNYWEPEKCGVVEIKGDLFETDCNVIAHGVNCSNGFGSGIAGIIAKKYPEVKHAYHNKFKIRACKWKLGDIQKIQVSPNRIIANCATQEKYGQDRKKVYADYKAVKHVMEELHDFCVDNELTLAIPKIGCGLGGLKYKKVKKILEEVFTKMEVKVYSLEVK